jgi:hypothetical protein
VRLAPGYNDDWLYDFLNAPAGAFWALHVGNIMFMDTENLIEFMVTLFAYVFVEGHTNLLCLKEDIVAF